MTDTCPRCLTSTEPQPPADDPQRYVCGACGHSWATSRTYNLQEPYATYDDPDAWEAHDPPPSQHREPGNWWDDPHASDPAEPDTDTQLVAAILARQPAYEITLTRLDTTPVDQCTRRAHARETHPASAGGTGSLPISALRARDTPPGALA
ncbi:hypothetical protein ACWD01_13065 [Streptomyces sp. NPDC002835]